MTSRIAVLVGVALTAACGGSVTKAADAGGGGGDGEDAAVCPPPGSPAVDVYMCEAGPAGSPGCTGKELGDKDVIYPEGCQVLLTRCTTFGQITCTCMRQPPFDDGGLEFYCPG